MTTKSKKLCGLRECPDYRSVRKRCMDSNTREKTKRRQLKLLAQRTLISTCTMLAGEEALAYQLAGVLLGSRSHFWSTGSSIGMPELQAQVKQLLGQVEALHLSWTSSEGWSSRRCVGVHAYSSICLDLSLAGKKTLYHC